MKKIFLSRRFGFTLVELLIVITIIGILMTLAAMAFLPAQKRVRDSKRKADLSAFQTGLKLFESDFKVYPNPTMYLGTVSSAATGDENNNLGLEADIATCQGSGVGGAGMFTMPQITNPSVASLNAASGNGTYYTIYTMRPGFESTNNFLVCLKLLDKVYQDVSFPTAGQSSYQYRISYDYSEYIVTARLENTSDREAVTYLFSDTTNKGSSAYPRYQDGNGNKTRQLDDDTNANPIDSTSNPIDSTYGELDTDIAGRGGFYTISSAPTAFSTYRDGWYFYQCSKKPDGSSIPLDDRSSPTYAPLVLNANGQYVVNAVGCKNNLSVGAGGDISYTLSDANGLEVIIPGY